MRHWLQQISTRWYLWAVWGVWVLVVCAVQLWRLNHFAYTGFDLAIYTQVFWNLTHGEGFFSSIQDHSYLSDHLEPILLVFWPFMKLFFSPLWLLWGQTLLLASSIFPLYRISRKVLAEYQALIIPVLFLLHTTTWNTTLVEFHALTLAIPLLFWVAVLFIEGKARWWQWLLVLLGVVLVREEMGLVVIGFSVLALIKKRGLRWWLPALLLGAMATLLTRWVQSWFVDSYRYVYYFPWFDLLQQGQYSKGLLSAFGFLFRIDVLRMVLEALLALGLVWLLAAEWLIPAIPVIASLALLDANVSHALIESYHAAVPYTLLWVAIPFGLKRAQQLLNRIFPSGPAIPYGLLLCMLAPTVLSTWLFLWWAYPADSSDYQPEDISTLTQQIDAGDHVVASAAFLPLLADRSHLQASWYVFRGQDEFFTAPYELDPGTEWLLFDTNEFIDLRTQRDDFWTEQQEFLDLLRSEFSPVTSLGSVVLFQRIDQQPLQRSAFASLLSYTSGTPDAIPDELLKGVGDAVLPIVLPGPDSQIIGNHVFVDLYVSNPTRWKELETQFITPVIRLTSNGQELTVPLGYGLITPETIQTGDRMKMAVVLPERMWRAGKSKSELKITGELIELKGLSYGRYQSITHRTKWVETFLDTSVPIQ